MAMEVRYGKVRRDDVHDPIQFIGWAAHKTTGEKKLVSSYSTKRRAKELAQGRQPVDIAQELTKPLEVVHGWLGMDDV